eukprot:5798421-Amphidinium_carterae.1
MQLLGLKGRGECSSKLGVQQFVFLEFQANLSNILLVARMLLEKIQARIFLLDLCLRPKVELRLDSVRRLAMACKVLRERSPDTKQLVFVEEVGITQLQHCWQS